MFKRITLFFVLGVIVLVALYLTVVFQWSYSSGERAGWVQKFSRKGWICKTWEGELAMVTLPGAIPDKFYFTVRDPAVAARLENTVGQRVTLHYEQHRGLPGNCFGDTGYWVDGVTVAPPPAAPPVAEPVPAPVPVPAPSH